MSNYLTYINLIWSKNGHICLCHACAFNARYALPLTTTTRFYNDLSHQCEITMGTESVNG